MYDLFLENRDEIQGVKPDLVENLSDDIKLEQYLLVSGTGRKDYGLSVICVDLGYNIDFRTKYDSGLIESGKDLGYYHEQCKGYILSYWGLDMYRQWAKEHLRKHGKASQQYKIRKNLDS